MQRVIIFVVYFPFLLHKSTNTSSIHCFSFLSAVPAPAVSAAALGCVPLPARRKVDLKRLLVRQQPEVDPRVRLILST